MATQVNVALGYIKIPANTITQSFTRPNNVTAYGIGNIVSDNTNMIIKTLQLVNTQFKIEGLTLEIDSNSLSTIGAFRVHLFNKPVTIVTTDNVAFNIALAFDRDNYLGYITVNAPILLGSTIWSQTNDTGKVLVNFTGVLDGDTNLYCVLQTTVAYVPGANTVYRVNLNMAVTT